MSLVLCNMIFHQFAISNLLLFASYFQLFIVNISTYDWCMHFNKQSTYICICLNFSLWSTLQFLLMFPSLRILYCSTTDANVCCLVSSVLCFFSCSVRESFS